MQPWNTGTTQLLHIPSKFRILSYGIQYSIIF